MTLDIETAGALIPRRILEEKEDPVNMQKVKVLRTFVGLPADTKIGDIVVIPKFLAVQALDTHKVEFIAEPKPPETKIEKSVEPKVDEAPETKAESSEEPKESPKKNKKV